VYMIVATSESPSAPVEFHPDVLQFLTDFSDIMADELPTNSLLETSNMVLILVPGPHYPIYLSIGLTLLTTINC